MDEFEFEFIGRVDIHDFGRMAYTVVHATKDIIRKLSLSKNPRLRVDGIVAGQPFHGAFQPAKENRYYLILSKKFCKSARIKVGDQIHIGINVADQDAVDVPRRLQLALDANPRARKVWDSISSGKKRGFAYRVASAKRITTIENRIEEVIGTLSYWVTTEAT